MKRITPITLLLTAISTAAVVFYYAQEQWPTILLAAAEQGVYLALYAIPATLMGHSLLRLLGAQSSSRSLQAATSLALGLGALGLAELGLGLAGWLDATSLWTLLGLCTLAGLPSLRQLLKVNRDTMRELLARPLPLPGLWVVAGLYLGVMLIAATLMPGLLWKPDDPHPYDALIYHLQVPREWFQLGRILPLEHNVYSYFPFNVEIHYLAMMHQRGGPWLAMYQTQYFGILLALAAAAALYGTLRPATRVGAAFAAGLLLLTPWVAMLSSIAYVETGLIFYMAISLGWLITAIRQPTSSARPYLVAGLASGLAAGVKLTSLAMFTAPACLALVPLAFTAKTLRKAQLVQVATFALATLLTLSPWLIRNYTWTGNPVFPVAMSTLGHHHYTAEQVMRFEKAHQPREDQKTLAARVQAVTWQILLDWRMGLVLIPLAAGGFVLTARRYPREAWLCIAVIGGSLAVWLTTTHLQGRFFTMALPPLALLAGMIPLAGRWAEKLTPFLAGLLALAAVGHLSGFTLPGRATTLTGLDAYLAPAAETGRKGFFYFPDVAPLMSEEVKNALESGRTLLFVGKGQMFLQPGPMAQIRYRTVFDVDASGGRSLIDAWYGPAGTTAPADIVPVISVSELERLHATYHAIPAYSPADAQRFPGAIVGP